MCFMINLFVSWFLDSEGINLRKYIYYFFSKFFIDFKKLWSNLSKKIGKFMVLLMP